jgi:hypothetical protein
MESLAVLVVARPEAVEQVLDGLDVSSPGARAGVLEAMTRLVEDHLAPAARLFARADDDHRWIDLNAVAGTEVEGPELAVLRREFPSLRTPPGDAEIVAALARSGLTIDGPERRADFFRAWTAQRASFVLRRLVHALETLPPAAPDRTQAERKQLDRLREQPLPSLELSLLDIAARGM